MPYTDKKTLTKKDDPSKTGAHPKKPIASPKKVDKDADYDNSGRPNSPFA